MNYQVVLLRQSPSYKPPFSLRYRWNVLESKRNGMGFQTCSLPDEAGDDAYPSGFGDLRDEKNLNTLAGHRGG